MRASELEAWVLQVVDAVCSGRRYESTRIELKRDFPTDTQRAARRIAAHANAAHGDEILWIVGVDEEAHAVVGLGEEPDPQSWWLGVASRFEGVAPRLLRHEKVPVGSSHVLALLIETDRAPFVIKNPQYGKDKDAVELEVPWREATHTRSARREELLRVLSRSIRMPIVDVIRARLLESRGSLVRVEGSQSANRTYTWQLLLQLFIVPGEKGASTVFPGHRIRVQAGSSWEEMRELLCDVGHPLPTQRGNTDELEVDRPRTVQLNARGDFQKEGREEAEVLLVSWALVPAGSATAIDLQLELRRTRPGTWELEEAQVCHVAAAPWRPSVGPGEEV